MMTTKIITRKCTRTCTRNTMPALPYTTRRCITHARCRRRIIMALCTGMRTQNIGRNKTIITTITNNFQSPGNGAFLYPILTYETFDREVGRPGNYPLQTKNTIFRNSLCAKNMKKNIPLYILLLCVSLVPIYSCHKKTTPVNYGIKFDGRWVGINSCDSSMEAITIASPINNPNSVYYSGHTDTGFCSKSIVFYGSANGDSVLFPASVYEDSCGNGYTFYQYGTIRGVTLILTRIRMGTVNDTCIFTATK